MTKKIELTREQLYERVWSNPMSKVCKELGISNVGLAKVCMRYGIPKPGLGYWARLAHGKRVAKPPLPSVEPNLSRPIEFVIHEKVEEEVPDEVNKFKADELARIRALSIAVSTKEAKRVQELLFGRKTERKPEPFAPWVGWILMPRHWAPRINVGQESWARAVHLVTMIVASAEACGYSLGRDENGMNVLKVHDARIEIAIRERAKQVPYVPPKSKGEFRPVGESTFRHMPLGKCRLTIMDTRYHGLTHTWTESDKVKIGDVLPAVLDALVDIAAGKKHILMKEKAAEEERERRMRETLVREQQERDAQAIFKRIWTDVEAWEQSTRLREYLQARIQSERERSKDGEFSEGFTSWVAWTEKLIQRTDPLTKPIRDGWTSEVLPRLYSW